MRFHLQINMWLRRCAIPKRGFCSYIAAILELTLYLNIQPRLGRRTFSFRRCTRTCNTVRFLSVDSIRTYSPVSADISSHFANEHPSRHFAVLELRLLSHSSSQKTFGFVIHIRFRGDLGSLFELTDVHVMSRDSARAILWISSRATEPLRFFLVKHHMYQFHQPTQ